MLLEAMPAAIGILERDGLIYANTAFAFAFGYRSPVELLEAGGLRAILPTARRSPKATAPSAARRSRRSPARGEN